MLRIFAFFIDIALLFEALSSANWTGYIRSAEGVRHTETDGLFSTMRQGNLNGQQMFFQIPVDRVKGSAHNALHFLHQAAG